MTEIVIAGPYCTPLRNQILTGLKSFGVTSASIVDAYTLNEDGDTGREGASLIKGQWPVRQVYHVSVSPRAASWAEYLLLRTEKYELLSKPLEPRNARWAARWGGAMPKPWLRGTCASKRAPSPAPGSKPITLKKSSIGAHLLRQMGRN